MAFPLIAQLAIQAGGTILGGIGQIQAGNAQKRIAQINARSIEDTAEFNAQLLEEGTEANADILAFNARMLEAMARDSVRRGKEEEQRFRTDVRGFIGAQRAAFAGQNVEIHAGTALDVQMDTAYQAELDALTIRTNAAREAWGFQVEAESERKQERALRKTGRLQADATRRVGRSEALSLRMGGDAAASAGKWGAASTFLAGGANLAYQQFGFRRPSPLSGRGVSLSY